jgi:protease IV
MSEKTIVTPLKNKIFPVIKILALLCLISYGISMFFGFDTEIVSGNVAVIPIHGEITVLEQGGFSSNTASSEAIVASLEKAGSNPNIKAILLDIDSPGGSGVAADEIGQKLKSINKTKVAVVREIGTSAAYWIASCTDHIFANRLSMTGSIGVIGSYLDFSGLLNEYNVTYQRYVSGELKDMGSPFKEPSEQERKAMQSLIDKMKIFFVEEVALNRNMTIEKVNALATGEVFLGSEAVKLGLIDSLGTKEDALNYLETKLNTTVYLVEYKQKKSFSDLLAGFSSMNSREIGKFIYPFSNKLQLS